jgi:nickel-dependent lactate racemase
MEADLKIGIGCVTAHPQVGFSGGGKIILPGVAHIDSIAHYHLEVPRVAPDTMGLGRFDENVLRFNIEEAARMAGLDFKIDVLVNEVGEATHVVAGELLEAHARAVAIAKDHYATEPRPRQKQVMICNTFCKPNEMSIGCLMGILALDNGIGTVVVIANAPEGQVVHYMVGRFGTGYGGRQYPIAPVIPSIHLIVQAAHFDRTFGDWFSNPEDITFTKSWDQTRALLEQKHGTDTRAAVVPSASMAYYPE